MAEFWSNVWMDVRYALRGLRNEPGYAATVVLTLALGLGGVTTMLAIVDSVLLRPLALPHSEQLVIVDAHHEHESNSFLLSTKQIGEMSRETPLFSSVSGYISMPRPVDTGDGLRTRLRIQVTPNFFHTLGAAAMYGRLMESNDRGAPVAVVNAAFAREWRGDARRVLGASLTVSGRALTVIGVLPDSVPFPQGVAAPIIFTPLALSESDSPFTDNYAMVIARMQAGVTAAQAAAALRILFTHDKAMGAGQPVVPQVRLYASSLTGDIQSGLWSLLGGCAVLLLIACANATNLQLVRAADRMGEMRIRAALGASLGRLARQVVTECVVVSLLGAGLGLAGALGTVALVRAHYAVQYARFGEISLHAPVFGVCVLLAILVGAMVALVPILRVRRATQAKPASRERVTGRSWAMGWLVALQLALTCVLLVITALLVRTFRALEQVPLGFDAHDVTTLAVMPQVQNEKPQRLVQTVNSLLDAFRAQPGVKSVVMQTSLPFSSFSIGLTAQTDMSGRAYRESDAPDYSLVSGNFLEGSGTRLLQGGAASFESNDGPLAVLVNRGFVQAYLQGRNPIGVILSQHSDPKHSGSSKPFLPAATIVGVVQDEIQGGDLTAPIRPMVYLNYRQVPADTEIMGVFGWAMEFAVRSSLPQGPLETELRQALKRTAPDVAEMSLGPMKESMTASLGERRVILRLVSSFGIVALVLAAIWIYGVLSYMVTQRRKEIGIRMALGSSRARTTSVVAAQAATMVLVGVVAGCMAAWPAARLVRSALFGVTMLDPWSMMATTALLLTVSAVAAMLPAWRAARVNPMEVLRAE